MSTSGTTMDGFPFGRLLWISEQMESLANQMNQIASESNNSNAKVLRPCLKAPCFTASVSDFRGLDSCFLRTESEPWNAAHNMWSIMEISNFNVPLVAVSILLLAFLSLSLAYPPWVKDLDVMTAPFPSWRRQLCKGKAWGCDVVGPASRMGLCNIFGKPILGGVHHLRLWVSERFRLQSWIGAQQIYHHC